MKVLMFIFLFVFVPEFFFVSSNNKETLPDIPFSHYKIDNEKCSGFIHKSGTRVFFPAFCLLNKQGTICSKNITVSYRELRTPLDFILTKIPLKFQDGIKRKDLVSSGMFEMYAICNSDTLQVSKDKPVQIWFAVSNKLPNLESFRFNHKSNNWSRYQSPVGELPANSEGADSQDKLWGSSPQINQNSSRDSIEYYGEEDFFEGMSPEMEAKYKQDFKNRITAFKSMNIDNFGLYNYDYILKDENFTPILAEFSIKGTSVKLNRKIFVVYSDLNTVLEYTPAEWKTVFGLIPKNKLSIFSILEDGKIARFVNDKFDSTMIRSYKSKSYTFELSVSNSNENNLQELAKAVTF